MSNHLIDQTSPYLLQHANNPVDWYHWCEEAFAKAKAEDKPVFLSIGYSTCHWCHVMAHESFEDEETAQLLNRYFISIKVDKEERSDIDSIYMAVCQAYTGSGGWPTSIFMTPDQQPFFAGTYFPKTARYGTIGFCDLLAALHQKWAHNRSSLLQSAEDVIAALRQPGADADAVQPADDALIGLAIKQYKSSFDPACGGFGYAPKFPMPHNLLFLLTEYEKHGDTDCLKIAGITLTQMYRGGLFDHIGYGFCRYSTDRAFLVPHFEKMLYDNALLILAYCKAFSITQSPLYRDVAEKTGSYILREMTSPEGGFYSAQDADSDGHEGAYYVFEPGEILALLGEETGEAFNQYYRITPNGNFEGKNIPNLLGTEALTHEFDAYLPQVYAYRKNRNKLHLDDKILTAWNGLMIAAMCRLYRISRNPAYLEAAQRAQRFMDEHLYPEGRLHVSFRDGKLGEKGFLDEYANSTFAQLELYGATLDETYLKKALQLCKKALTDFFDQEHGGFYLYGNENESLILRPKDTYDGALPSGNSVMAHNLVRLFALTDDADLEQPLKQQLAFLSAEASTHPMGHSMFMLALSDYLDPPQTITVVQKHPDDLRDLPFAVSADAIVKILHQPTAEYPLQNDRTTYYVCKNHTCAPPTNELDLN